MYRKGDVMIIDLYEDYELTNDFFTNYKIDDIIMFSYAEPGAQGFMGNIEAVTLMDNKEIGIFSGSYLYKNPNLTESKVMDFFTPLIDEFERKKWTILNMGAGNVLFIKNEYSKLFKDKYEKIVSELGLILYKTWRYFADYYLNLKFNNNDDIEKLKKVNRLIGFWCYEFGVDSPEVKLINTNEIYKLASVSFEDVALKDKPELCYVNGIDDIQSGDKVLIDKEGKQLIGNTTFINNYLIDELEVSPESMSKIIKRIED